MKVPDGGFPPQGEKADVWTEKNGKRPRTVVTVRGLLSQFRNKLREGCLRKIPAFTQK